MSNAVNKAEAYAEDKATEQRWPRRVAIRLSNLGGVLDETEFEARDEDHVDEQCQEACNRWILGIGDTITIVDLDGDDEGGPDDEDEDDTDDLDEDDRDSDDDYG